MSKSCLRDFRSLDGDTFLYGVEVLTVGDVLHRFGNGEAEFE